MSQREEILDLIAHEARLERARLDLSATPAALGVRSLDLVQVAFALEDRYGITLPYSDPAALGQQSVGSLVETVEGLLASRP
jgi:acyl carrier protein